MQKVTWRTLLAGKRKKEEEGAKKRNGDIATGGEARATPPCFWPTPTAFLVKRC